MDASQLQAQSHTAAELTDQLADTFAQSAVARDADGGTPKLERDLLRDSGLLSMIISRELGGWGASWPETLASVRRIAQADGSLAHVFGFQHLMLATLRLFAAPAQWQAWFRDSVEQRWFWGNALNPLDPRTSLTWQGDLGRIDGHKSFCSGALDSDMLIVSALDAQTHKLVIAAIPTGRAGIELHDDWDCIGQRQTDSGSARFDNVVVSRAELLATPGPLGSTFASLRPCIAQLILCNVYVGIAQGALQAARTFTLGESHAWFKSGVERASQDPYVIRNYGELFTQLEAARCLSDEAAQLLEAAWEQGDLLAPEERGGVAIATAVAKVSASRAALDTTSRMFDVMGARATAGKARLDRFWRNVRVHTLHDPLDYKLRDIGTWALSSELPTPSFYS
jgi:alkylation response protein AidB-like acyl-CoA dehydrogenase